MPVLLDLGIAMLHFGPEWKTISCHILHFLCPIGSESLRRSQITLNEKDARSLDRTNMFHALQLLPVIFFGTSLH